MAMLGFNPTYNGIVRPVGWSARSKLQRNGVATLGFARVRSPQPTSCIYRAVVYDVVIQTKG